MINKICLILGSNSDIGQALAYKFAENNYNIILATRLLNEYQYRLKEDISIKYNVNASNIRFDGNKYEEHNEFWNSFKEIPDVVIVVFGYLGNQQIAMHNFKEAFEIISSNYIAQVSLLNQFVQKSKGTKKTTIIGISSVAGERGRQSNYIYGSAKAAFTTYLSGLRNDLFKSEIHVMTVLPGFMNTKMIENIQTPKLLTANPQYVASKIYSSYQKKKNIVYILPIWRLIMIIIRSIPEFIFKKLNL